MKFLYTFRVSNGRTMNGMTTFDTGQTYHYTNYDDIVPYDMPGAEWRLGGASASLVPGGPWLPAAIEHDRLSWSQEQTSGDLKIRVDRSNPVAVLFQTGQPPGSVWLQIWLADEEQDRALPVWLGRIKQCEFGTSEATLTGQLIDDILRRPALVQTYGPTCPWPVYSAQCGLARDATDPATGHYLRRVDGVLNSVSEDQQTLTADVFATRADGYFTRGLLVIGGQSRLIVGHAGNTVTLLTATQQLTAGTPFSAYWGCSRVQSGCNSQGNIANFGGFTIPIINLWTHGVPV